MAASDIPGVDFDCCDGPIYPDTLFGVGYFDAWDVPIDTDNFIVDSDLLGPETIPNDSDPLGPKTVPNDSDWRDLGKSLGSSPDAQKGRPKKQIHEAELLKYVRSGCMLKEAAKGLKVSPSTLKRRLKERGKTWSGLQQNISVSQLLHDGNDRMQREEKVLITVDYRGRKAQFDLPLTKTLKGFQTLIKDHFNIDAETYEISYLSGDNIIHIFSNKCLKGFLSRASSSSAPNSIILQH